MTVEEFKNITEQDLIDIDFPRNLIHELKYGVKIEKESTGCFNEF